MGNLERDEKYLQEFDDKIKDYRNKCRSKTKFKKYVMKILLDFVFQYEKKEEEVINVAKNVHDDTLEYIFAIIKYTYLAEEEHQQYVPLKIESIKDEISDISDFFKPWKKVKLKYDNLIKNQTFDLLNKIGILIINEDYKPKKRVKIAEGKIRSRTIKFMKILVDFCNYPHNFFPISDEYGDEEEQEETTHQKNLFLDKKRWICEGWEGYIVKILKQPDITAWDFREILHFNSHVKIYEQKVLDYITRINFLLELFDKSSFWDNLKFLSVIKRAYPRKFQKIIQNQKVKRYFHKTPIDILKVLGTKDEYHREGRSKHSSIWFTSYIEDLSQLTDWEMLAEVGEKKFEKDGDYYNFFGNVDKLLEEKSIVLTLKLVNYFQSLIKTLSGRSINTILDFENLEAAKIIDPLLTNEFILETCEKYDWNGTFKYDLMMDLARTASQVHELVTLEGYFHAVDDWIINTKEISFKDVQYGVNRPIKWNLESIEEYWGDKGLQEYYSIVRLNKLFEKFGSFHEFYFFILEGIKKWNPDYYKEKYNPDGLTKLKLENKTRIRNCSMIEFHDFISANRRISLYDENEWLKIMDEFVWNHAHDTSLKKVWRNLQQLWRYKIPNIESKKDKIANLIKKSSETDFIFDEVLAGIHEHYWEDKEKGLQVIREVLPFPDAKKRAREYLKELLNDNKEYFSIMTYRSIDEYYKEDFEEFEITSTLIALYEDHWQLCDKEMFWILLGVLQEKEEKIELFLHFDKKVKEYAYERRHGKQYLDRIQKILLPEYQESFNEFVSVLDSIKNMWPS